MLTTRAGDVDIAYEITGSGDPLLLIMGFAADSRMWMLQTPAFAKQYRCITFDNRGVGHSSKPAGPYSMEQMASDALAVLDAADAERAHVVGISMGGAIAQHLALKAPERVRSLVLASTWCAPNPYLPRLADIGTLLMDNAGPEAVIRASMLWLFTPAMIVNSPDMVGVIESQALEFAADREVFFAQQAAVFEHDTRDRLGSLTMPALVMVGRRDVFVPPELSMQIVEAMPRAEFTMLEAGHAYNLEEMDAFNKTVLDFIARH